MCKKRVSSLMKRLIAGCMAMAIVVSGIKVLPNTAKAADDAAGISYEQLEMGRYWNAENKTAPVKPNCVFAGWYTKDERDEFAAIKEAEGIPTSKTTYAKFVPAYVLSVKTQVEAKAEIESSEAADKGDDFSTFMRVLSSVDSGNYQNVGFEIFLGDNEVELELDAFTKVYDGLKLSATDKDAIYPEDVFGEASDYFTALDLKNIKATKFSSKIYIRPYWTTLDGTKVEGLARNVRVEDKYTDYKYVSVPINLLTDGVNPVKVAAGMVEVTYDATKAVVAKDAQGNYRIDTGRLLKDMEYNVIPPAAGETTGKIIFAGSGIDTTEEIMADGLYANIRFQSATDAKLTESDLNLTKTAKEFCDWEENTETVTAW